MFFTICVTLIILVSLMLSYWSIKQDKKRGHMKEVREKLTKGRVIFYAKTPKK